MSFSGQAAQRRGQLDCDSGTTVMETEAMVYFLALVSVKAVPLVEGRVWL